MNKKTIAILVLISVPLQALAHSPDVAAKAMSSAFFISLLASVYSIYRLNKKIVSATKTKRILKLVLYSILIFIAFQLVFTLTLGTLFYVISELFL